MSDGSIEYRCPVKQVTRDTANFLQMYNHCEKFKQLPFAGSVSDQPAKIMQAFSYIQRAINDRTKELLEKTKHGKHRP